MPTLTSWWWNRDGYCPLCEEFHGITKPESVLRFFFSGRWKILAIGYYWTMIMSVFVYYALSLIPTVSFPGSVISKWMPVQIWIFGCCLCLFQFSRQSKRDHRMNFSNSYRHLYSWPQAFTSSNLNCCKRYLPFSVFIFFVVSRVECYVWFLSIFHLFQPNSFSYENVYIMSFASPTLPAWGPFQVANKYRIPCTQQHLDSIPPDFTPTPPQKIAKQDRRKRPPSIAAGVSNARHREMTPDDAYACLTSNQSSTPAAIDGDLLTPVLLGDCLRWGGDEIGREVFQILCWCMEKGICRNVKSFLSWKTGCYERCGACIYTW